MPKRKLLGMLQLGGVNVRLMCEEDFGGWFATDMGDDGLPALVIGLAGGDYQRIITAALHELMEFEAHMMGLRFSNASDIGEDLGSFTFLMRHDELSELCSRVGPALLPALEMLSKEFNSRYPKRRSKEKRAK